MAENNREALPQFSSTAALTDFFDAHDMGDYIEALPEAQFEVNIKTRQYLVAVDANIMQQVIAIAKAQHISAETLINQWLEEQTRKAA
ncbi:MAG TPA: CopG family antitoxin [Herpetosiphonaceae bacterium]